MKKLFCLLLVAMLLLAGCGTTTPAEPTEPPFEVEFPTMPPLADGATDEEILQYRRDLVEQQMRYMCTVRWTPTETIEYSLVNKSKGLEADKQTNPGDIVTLYKGTIYEGLPYTHGSNSAYAFMEYATGLTETGTLIVDGIETADLSGYGYQEPNRCARLGTDCADQVFWAWNHISTSITFEYCANMVPGNGCIPVGDYTHNETYFNYTFPIADANGIDVMCESYAKMQKGDAMVFINSKGAGHAIMNVEVHVVRNEDGTINPQESYAITLEQESGDERTQIDTYVDETTGQTITRLQGIDREYSFQYLYDKGYLPVTCKELIDPSPLPEPKVEDSVQAPTVETMFTGFLKANYRIASVTATITDKDGKPVQQATCNSLEKELFSFDLGRFVADAPRELVIGKIDVSALSPGQYGCVFDCRLSTGAVIRIRDFTFTV